MITNRVGCINIPTGAGRGAWERAFLAVMARSDIFGLNEAFNSEAKRIYAQLAQEHGYGHYALGETGNPIFWDRSKYVFVDGEVRTLHGRGPSYDEWPGFNESRELSVVLLRPRGSRNGDGDEFVVANTHLVPNGNKVLDWWRTKVRTKSRIELRRLVKDAIEEEMPCYLMGDMNIHRPFLIARGFRWIKGKGIDKVGLALPKKFKRGKAKFSEFAAPIDHKHGVATVSEWSRRR